MLEDFVFSFQTVGKFLNIVQSFLMDHAVDRSKTPFVVYIPAAIYWGAEYCLTKQKCRYALALIICMVI